MGAPVSTTTAASRGKRGVQAGFVNGATRTSPDCNLPNSAGPRTIRTGPSATPALPGIPNSIQSLTGLDVATTLGSTNGWLASASQRVLRAAALVDSWWTRLGLGGQDGPTA